MRAIGANGGNLNLAVSDPHMILIFAQASALLPKGLPWATGVTLSLVATQVPQTLGPAMNDDA